MAGVLLLIIALVGGFILAYKMASQVSRASVKLGGWSSVLAGIVFILVFSVLSLLASTDASLS